MATSEAPLDGVRAPCAGERELTHRRARHGVVRAAAMARARATRQGADLACCQLYHRYASRADACRARGVAVGGVQGWREWLRAGVQRLRGELAGCQGGWTSMDIAQATLKARLHALLWQLLQSISTSEIRARACARARNAVDMTCLATRDDCARDDVRSATACTELHAGPLRRYAVGPGQAQDRWHSGPCAAHGAASPATRASLQRAPVSRAPARRRRCGCTLGTHMHTCCERIHATGGPAPASPASLPRPGRTGGRVAVRSVYSSSTLRQR